MRGRAVSLAVTMVRVFFSNLKLLSMLLMILDRFLAVKYGLRYKMRMSPKKMFSCMIMMWVTCVVILVPWFLALYKIDLGNVSANLYKVAYYKAVDKRANSIILPFVGIAMVVISVLTRRSFKKELGKFLASDKTSFNVQGNQLKQVLTKQDYRAVKTIFWTYALHALCYLPVFMYAIFIAKIAENRSQAWIVLLCEVSILFIGSAFTPVIYLIRSRGLRRAVTSLLINPCNASDFILPFEPTHNHVKSGNKIGVLVAMETIAGRNEECCHGNDDNAKAEVDQLRIEVI